LNLYGFVGNDGVNIWDDLGLIEKRIFGVFIGSSIVEKQHEAIRSEINRMIDSLRKNGKRNNTDKCVEFKFYNRFLKAADIAKYSKNLAEGFLYAHGELRYFNFTRNVWSASKSKDLKGAIFTAKDNIKNKNKRIVKHFQRLYSKYKSANKRLERNPKSKYHKDALVDWHNKLTRDGFRVPDGHYDLGYDLIKFDLHQHIKHFTLLNGAGVDTSTISTGSLKTIEFFGCYAGVINNTTGIISGHNEKSTLHGPEGYMAMITSMKNKLMAGWYADSTITKIGEK